MFLNLGLGRMGCLAGALAAAGPALDLNFIDGSAFSPLITYTRSSPATQFYSDGQRDWAPENLLLRSDEIDNASWAKNNATIGANAVAGANGVATLDAIIEDTTPSGFHYAQQAYTKPAQAQRFAFSFLISDNGRQAAVVLSDAGGSNGVVGRVNAATGTVTFAAASFGTGWTAGAITMAATDTAGVYRCLLTATSDASTTIVAQVHLHNGSTNVYTGNGSSGVYIGRARLQRGTHSLAIDDAILQTTSAARYGPRYNDYNPATLAICGFLIEEQRTNLALYSGYESNAAWTKTATSVGTGATGLDGTTASRRLTSSSTTPLLAQSSITVVASTTYTYSVFLRYVDTNWLRIQYMDSTFTNGVRGWVNLNGGGTAALGTVANIGTGSGGAHTLTNLGGGWYLYTLSGAAGTATAAGPSIRPTTGDSTAIGVSGVSYDVDGHQLEAGTFATSYMPTTTASAVRGADVPQVTGAAFTGFYNSAAGTLVWEGVVSSLHPTTNQYMAAVSDGTINNRAFVAFNQFNTTTLERRHTVGGSASTPGNVAGGVTHGAVIKVGISTTAGTLITSLGGSTTGAASPASMPTVDRLSIGCAETAATAYLNGWVRRIRYYPRALSQAELNALTA